MDNIKRGPNNFNNNFSQRRPAPGIPMRRPIQGIPMRRPPFPGQNMHGPGARAPVNKNSTKAPNKLLIMGGVVLTLIIVLVLIIILIARNSEKDVDKKQLDMKIESVKLEEDSAQVNLQIDPKEEEIVGIKFIFETEEDYEVFKQDVSISKITKKEFTFELKEIDGKKITRISVSPIFENKKGEEVLGSVEDDYFIEVEDNEENDSEEYYEDYNDSYYYPQEYSEDYYEYWDYETPSNQTNNQNISSNQSNPTQNNSQTNYTPVNYPEENISRCGDNIVNPGEFCDSGNLAGETCVSLGYASGTLGCRKTCEFDTRYCTEKPPINNSPPSNNTPNPPANCISYSYSQCYNGDVYWYNSCNQRGTIKEDCFSDETCTNNECVVKQTTPTCISNSYSQCYNGDVYWYNSCGTRGIMREDCTSSETCTNNACVTTCTSNSYSQCYNGDVYWYNSCDQRGSIRTDCTASQTCTNNACVASSVCGNGVCSSGETCSNCPKDCGCSGNQICSVSDHQCLNECYWTPDCTSGYHNGKPNPNAVCLNGVCVVNSDLPSGNSDFSFTHYFISSNPPSGSFLAEQAVGDYDNDGDLDFTVGVSDYSSNPQGIVYLFNNNGGSNWPNTNVGNIPKTSLGAWSHDVNNDGRIDVISTGVWYQNNGGSFTTRTYDSNPVTSTDGFHDLILADVNNDGKKDVIVHNEDIGTFWYNIPSNPTSTWTKTTIDTTCVGASPKVHGGFSPGGAGDLDGDGDNDIFRANAWFENRNNGANWIMHSLSLPGLFQPPLTYGKSTRSFIIDIDNDGDNDVVFTECDNIYSKAGIIYNTNGNFGSYQLSLLPQTATGKRGSLHNLWVADFNIDGKLDILSADQEDMMEMDDTIPSMRWYMWTNTGSGWNEQVLVNRGTGGHDTLAGDADQDGDLDLFTKEWYPWSQNSNSGRKHIDWYENNKIEQSSTPIKLSMNPSSGWHTHGSALWQSVNGGYITGQQNPPGSGNGGFLISDQTFGDYEVVFDVWPDYGTDSGIFLRNTNTDEQAYQVTIDYQPENPMGSVYITNVGDYREFSLVDEDEISGSSPYFDSDAWSYIWKENDWNQFRISIEGNPPKIIVWINGFKVHEYTDTQARFPSSGYIALQVHPGSSEWPSGKVVRFRNIKVYPK